MSGRRAVVSSRSESSRWIWHPLAIVAAPLTNTGPLEQASWRRMFGTSCRESPLYFACLELAFDKGSVWRSTRLLENVPACAGTGVETVTLEICTNPNRRTFRFDDHHYTIPDNGKENPIVWVIRTKSDGCASLSILKSTECTSPVEAGVPENLLEQIPDVLLVWSPSQTPRLVTTQNLLWTGKHTAAENLLRNYRFVDKERFNVSEKNLLRRIRDGHSVGHGFDHVLDSETMALLAQGFHNPLGESMWNMVGSDAFTKIPSKNPSVWVVKVRPDSRASVKAFRPYKQSPDVLIVQFANKEIRFLPGHLVKTLKLKGRSTAATSLLKNYNFDSPPVSPVAEKLPANRIRLLPSYVADAEVTQEVNDDDDDAEAPLVFEIEPTSPAPEVEPTSNVPGVEACAKEYHEYELPTEMCNWNVMDGKPPSLEKASTPLPLECRKIKDFVVLSEVEPEVILTVDQNNHWRIISKRKYAHPRDVDRVDVVIVQLPDRSDAQIFPDCLSPFAGLYLFLLDVLGGNLSLASQ